MKMPPKFVAAALALTFSVFSVSSASALTGVGSDALRRAQAPGLIGPKPTRVAERTARQAKAADAQSAEKKDAKRAKAADKEAADKKAAGTQDAKAPAKPVVEKQDPGKPLTVRAVAVIRGKGVKREVADIVRNAVEDALNDKGVIGSNDLDRRLIVVRQHLINQGFYLSRIMRVGPQGGVTAEGILPLHLQVGTVQEIEVAFKGKKPGEDGKWFSNAQVKDRFSKVKEGDGFNYGQLYYALYGLNAHPDLVADVHVGVTPGGGEEGDTTAKFRLNVEEQMPLHGSIEINNYGIDAVDNWQAEMAVQYLNVSGADDALTIAPTIALNGDQWSVAANYTRPFKFWKGGSLSIYGGYSDSDIETIEGSVIRDLNYEGYGAFGGAQLTLNLIDNERHNLAAYAGLMYRSADQQLKLTGVPLQEYRVGMLPLTLGLSYTNRAPDALGGRNFATASLTYNLASLHDEIRDLWPRTENHYAILRAQYARIQPLFGKATLDQGYDAQWTSMFRIEAQWSNDELMPYEQLSLGGHDNLRGYRTNGCYGDRGVYGTLEIRTPVWRDMISSFYMIKDFFPATDKDNPDSWIDSVQFLAFLDFGWMDRLDPWYAQDDAQFLWSVGLGARMAVTKYTSLSLDVAFPCRNLNENDDDDKNVEAYLGVRAQF